MKKTRDTYTPDQELISHFPEISGNTVNGLGEENKRAPNPFFWHPPERQTHGELQQYIVGGLRPAAGEDRSFRNPDVDRGPALIPVSPSVNNGTAASFSHLVKEFALANEADQVGITPLEQEYVYEGYDEAHPNLVMIAVAHDFDKLTQAPGSADNLSAYHDLHDQYNRAARCSNKLVNFVHEQGYSAKAYPGPMADALLMIPAAIAAGLGELGKHGSMIHKKYGSGFRLSAVATDMPLEFDSPDSFGVDDFCLNCQVCQNECPPDAIYNEKQMVRGTEKWYVDFDKCIPYFGENYACGICIAVCPWTLPGVADNILQKMARRSARKNGDDDT